MTDAGPDLASVVAEVEDEVRRRRAAGEIPPGLERELDEALARFALDDTAGGAFDRHLSRVERAVALDVNPSFASARPGVAAAKKLVHTSVGFEVRHVAGQVGELGAGVVDALRAIDRRLAALEGGELLDLLPERPAPDLRPWTDRVVGWLAGAGGRVAHADAGDGGFVDALRAGGLDAYGVEGAVEAHLASVPAGGLGGLVLSGWVDEAPPATRWRVLRTARDVVAPGGWVVVVAADRAAWEAGVPAVVADLAPGRPFRPETWAHLLGRAGFDEVEVHPGDASHAVTATRPR